MKKIYVADYSLKKFSEDRKVSLLFREKTAIAECIEAFGADAVELYEIKKLKEDTIIYRTIASKVKNCAVCIPVGFSADDVCAAYECIKDAAKPCLQVALPVSTVQMEYMYHVKEAKMLTKIEGEGLILRRQSEEDKRQTIVSITEAGRNRVALFREAHRSRAEKFCSPLTEEEKITSNLLMFCDKLPE